MTLRFCESWDHYTTVADATEKWTAYDVSEVGQTIATGRHGSNGWTTGSGGRGLVMGFPALATWVCGVALNMGGAGGGQAVFQLREGGTEHISVCINADLSISVRRGNTGGTVLGSSSAGVIPASGFCFIEAKVTIHDTTGSYEIRVNGANVVSGTNVDTRNGLTGVVTAIALVFPRSNAIFDDFYICDTTGSIANDFLGDIRVDYYAPNGNGNSSQLLGSDGNSTDNYLLVDEVAPNDDTDYVESATVGQKDTYSFPNMAHTPSNIYGMQILVNAKKSDAGLRSICTVIRSGGADTDGATQALSTSYKYYREIHEADPNTSAAWTQSGVNSAEVGEKVAA